MIKKEEMAREAAAVAVPFDKEMCLAEARNGERLMKFYLSRCDDPDVTKELREIFEGLAEKCRKKVTRS